MKTPALACGASVAAVSDDGVTISQHFGRAAYYVVVTVENNRIVARETREKMGHAQFGGETHAEGNDPRGHGYDPTAQSRHSQMVAAIADCQVLLARGTLAPQVQVWAPARTIRCRPRASAPSLPTFPRLTMR
ncbi:MAG: hypothetical protein M1482_17030 [Chloroflexi bacterium]|nr:hypothetical protein [Chloroflexota bacterium]